MKWINKVYILIIFLIFINGCASTKLTSFVDPDFTNKYYNKILVIYPTSDLLEKREVEDIYVKAFDEIGIKAFSDISLFPPTREYSNEDMIKKINTLEIVAVLYIEFTDAWNEETYIPETQTTTTKGNVKTNKNSAKYKEKSTTYTSGGYYVKKPRVKFETSLLDINQDRIAWIASTLTEGNSLANFSKLISSMAYATVEDLIKNRLIIPNK